MSFILKNLSVSDVEIGDIGISIPAGENYDLADESASDVAHSADLVDAVTLGVAIILDPLDDVTPLTQSQSIDAIQSANDTHFRIRGGELDQLDDVSVPSPLDTYVLTYVTANNQWESKPPSGGGGSTNTCFPFYKADGTYDPITVTSGQFPFFKSDGTQDNIIIQIC